MSEKSNTETVKGETGTAHTPGPWFSAGDNFVYALNESGTCNRFDLKVEAGFTEYLRTPDREISANAKLIAAAPDLLAACESWIAWFEERVSSTEHGPLREAIHRFHGDRAEATRAAIAHAKGTP